MSKKKTEKLKKKKQLDKSNKKQNKISIKVIKDCRIKNSYCKNRIRKI